MLNPNELLHISEGAEDIAEQLHNEIIKKIIERIMIRIGRGDKYILTSKDKWQLETLQQAGYLLEEIQKEIAKKTNLQQKEIAEAMEDAGVKTLEYDGKIYSEVGLENAPLNKSPELIRIAQRNYEATMGEFKNFTRTMVSKSQQLFISECDKAYDLVATGALSYSEAVKEVINNIVSDGVLVTYPSGHTDTIETATMRAVRTGISQMSAQVQLKRMEENEVDRVIISSHLGARPSHHVWQGKIYTLEQLRSTNEGMPAYGTVSGLCGANCRHSFSPYFDFMENPFNDYNSEENKKQHEKEQKQRLLERRIRKTKREVIGLKESVDRCKDDKAKFELDLQYQKKSVLLSKQNDSYKEYCKNNGLKPLSERIQIAKWDRQQAAAARDAAKRYENAIKETNYLRNNLPKNYNDKRKIGKPISEQQIYKVKEKANYYGIKIKGFENYCGDVLVLEKILDQLHNNKKQFVFKNVKEKNILLNYDNVLGYLGDNSKIDVESFAMTKGNTITLNKFMFDDSKYLKEEYKKAVEIGYFAKGTSYLNIIDHEYGHIINKINPRIYNKVIEEIEKKAYNKNVKTNLFIKENISTYAKIMDINGKYNELIPELYSMLNGKNKELALELFRKAGVLYEN